MCDLDISFVKSILYKRIVTKFFWDYCLNSRVCNFGKRVVIIGKGRVPGSSSSGNILLHCN